MYQNQKHESRLMNEEGLGIDEGRRKDAILDFGIWNLDLSASGRLRILDFDIDLSFGI